MDKASIWHADDPGDAARGTPQLPSSLHWSQRIKRSDPADLWPNLYGRLFPRVFRREPYDIPNAGLAWPAPVAGDTDSADVDAMLYYLEAVLVSLEHHTVPVIIQWPHWDEAPLLVEGETLKQHLERVVGVLKRLRGPQRQQASVQLTSIIHNHYRAWLELIEHWKGEFPGLLPLRGFYPDYVDPTTYYRAVSDTRVTDRPFDRWTRSWTSAEADLRWRHDRGPCPGIISINTHHAIGPFRDTGFSAEIDGAFCCEHMIATARNEDLPELTRDNGEYFIDSVTQMHCSAPRMAWPMEDVNDVMLAEMPDDACWTPDDYQPEPTSLPEEHLDDPWNAPQLRFCLREALPPYE